MELDLNTLAIETDGSLRNPAVAAAVVVWTALLSGLTWLLVSWIQAPLPGSPGAWRRRRGIGYSFLVLLFASTLFTQLLLANIFYRFVWQPGPDSSIGFWGGPPLSPALGISAFIGLLSLRREKARVSRARQSQS